MAFKIPQWDEGQRTRILGLVLLLGLVVSLPTPMGNFTSRQDVALLMIWVGTLCAAWAIWFRRDLMDLFWVVAALGSLLSILFKGSWFSLVGLCVWRFWFLYRERRVSTLRIIALAWMLSAGVAVNDARAQNVTPAKTAVSATTASPDASVIAAATVGDDLSYLKGYKINAMTSCRQVDIVPWTFNKDNRQVRLLLRDSLRLSTETKYSDWSVYQTMDEEGSVTFIFQRTQSDGSKEYQLTKGSVFNRIVRRGRNKTVAEVKNLKNLIDSPALEFYHKDGSQMSFLPGSNGTSKLRIYLAAKPGARILPPLYLDGRNCSRPESAFDQDDDPGKKSNANKSGPAAAPIAGGASSSGASGAATPAK